MADPGCLKNLIDQPDLAKQIDEFRAELLKVMRGTKDQELANLILQKQRVMRDAYLTKIGHGHPGLKPGPSVEEAKRQAGDIELRIQKQLGAMEMK